MAMRKCEAIFSAITEPFSATFQERAGGWSEAWYMPAEQSDYKAAFRRWCERRAGILSTGYKIIGQRYGLVDPRGPSFSEGFPFVGTLGGRDVPSMALLCRASSANLPNRRSVKLAGIPDANVQGGEVRFTNAFLIAFQFLNNQTSGLYFHGRNLTTPTVEIQNIDENGNFKLAANLTFVAGQKVRVLRTNQVATGRQRGGAFLVETRTDDRTGKLFGWGWGVTVGGKMRLELFVFPQCETNPLLLKRVTNRKIGRPSNPYVGRVSHRQ